MRRWKVPECVRSNNSIGTKLSFTCFALVFATLKTLQLTQHRIAQKTGSRITYLASVLHVRPPDETKCSFSMTCVRHTQRREPKKIVCVQRQLKFCYGISVCASRVRYTRAPVSFCVCAQSRPRCSKLFVTFAFPTNPSAQGRANRLVQECGCDTGN